MSYHGVPAPNGADARHNNRYIGVPVRRREDPGLLAGRSQTVADIVLPDTLDLAFARSPLAHARVGEVDVSAARELPGVAGAWAAADLPDLPPTGTPFGDPAAYQGRDRFPLAKERVRFAGEPLAVVAAPTRALAEDGAELVRAELEARHSLLGPRQAASSAAPQLFAGLSNVVSDRKFGEPADDALAEAPVVVEASYIQQPLIHTSMEARAVLVRTDDDGGFTVWVSHQAQHGLRKSLAATFGLSPERVRVVVPAVGGAFGAKSGTYPEYVLAVYLARLLGRPVRWIEDRAEALRTSTRGRAQYLRVRLGADTDGRLLAYELLSDANVGAYPHVGDPIPTETGAMSTGCYATPRVFARIRTVVTTTPPTSAYRGAGRPEAAFAIERTMDVLARRLKIDPAELRRRNFIREFPYRTPTGREYDSGDYATALDLALQAIDYENVRAEQRRRRSEGGAPLGIGIASYVERAGGPPRSEEYGSVEVEPDGSVLARSGSTCTGQAHPTVFPQVVASALDIDLDRVRLVQNDTREVPHGYASFGSRSLQVGGGALWCAAERLMRDARQRFAALQEVDVSQVGYARGRLVVRSDRGQDIKLDLGDIVQRTGPLRAEETFRPPQSFPFGSYAAVVEVDPELGGVTIRKLVAVDDYGVVVNPMVVNGQGYGSIAQGIGQALFEEARYAGDGTPIAETLLDYLLPTAADMPPLELLETSTPNPNNGFGAKGAGEAGCIGAPPAIVNAVCDALDVDHVEMPLTPEAVWRAFRLSIRNVGWFLPSLHGRLGRVVHPRQPLRVRAGQPVLRVGQPLAHGHKQQVGDEVHRTAQEPLRFLRRHPGDLVAPGRRRTGRLQAGRRGQLVADGGDLVHLGVDRAHAPRQRPGQSARQAEHPGRVRQPHRQHDRAAFSQRGDRPGGRLAGPHGAEPGPQRVVDTYDHAGDVGPQFQRGRQLVPFHVLRLRAKHG